jgi:hypothetical protein
LALALLTAGLGALALVIGDYAALAVALAAVALLAGGYIVLALIFGWWLPGGMAGPEPDAVTDQDSDEVVGRECLLLAQSMWELLTQAQRDAPGYSTERVPMSATSEEMHEAWQHSVTANRVHENKVIAQFLERFGVRLSGVLHELVQRGRVTDEEAKSLWWKTQTIHWLNEIPQFLATKGREMGARP